MFEKLSKNYETFINIINFVYKTNLPEKYKILNHNIFYIDLIIDNKFIFRISFINFNKN
jgi:hypothetical protein